MRNRRARVVWALSFVFVACGPAKAPGDSSSGAGDSRPGQPSLPARPTVGPAPAAPGQPVITATTPDRPAPAADSVVRSARPAADTAKKSAALPKKGEEPLRDSAYGPKFKVDSMGRVTPIKKP